ncbi:MAG: FAD-dependent oxidoreductase [Lautropia sp.]
MQTASPAYPLLSPFTLAGRPLRNRVIHASMTTRLAHGGRVTDRFIQYNANRARGGAALIVTEPMSFARHQDLPSRIRVFDDDDLDGLSRLADAVESLDCRLVCQLMERGRGRNLRGRSFDAIGASALPDDLSWTMPRELRADEIDRLVEEFAQSSRRVKRCGFSGIEISAAHGHFFHQFLSPWSNVRTDGYGGSVEGRTRLLRELIAAIRAECGTDFIIGLKLPGDDGVPGGVDIREAALIAARLAAPGVADYLCFAQGSHARSLERHVPDGFSARVPYLPLVRELRRAVPGVPVAALGRITDPAEAEAIVARGDAELVALGRPLVTDPAWVMKAAANRTHEIRYCVGCNTCWDRISGLQLPLACDNNPRVAEPDEVDFWPARARVPKRIVVIGAGVAGMEAAWVAAARGHQVIVFGRSGEVGGKARLRSLLPGGEDVSSVFDYQLAAAMKVGVRFELGHVATLADVLATRPDEVVIATGSIMVPPPWLPTAVQTEGLVPDLRTAIQDVLRLKGLQAGTAVVYDMDHSEGTYAAALALHATFERAVIITPRDSIADDIAVVVRQGILRRMHEQRIGLVTLAEPRWSDTFEENGSLEYANVYNGDIGRVDDVAFLSWATPRTPLDAFSEPLRELGIPFRVVGDCRSARGLLAATAEGHAVGNAV